MKKSGLILFVLVLSICTVNSQYVLDNLYFKNYKEHLKEDSTITDIQEIKTYHENNNMEHHGLYVKYASDSVVRYFPIGKSIDYYKNGNLKSISNISPLSNQGIDTTIRFNRKGEIESIIILFHMHNLSSVHVDTSIRVDVDYYLQREYILEKDYSYFDMCFGMDTTPINLQLPNCGLQVSYDAGIRRQIGKYRTSYEGMNNVPDGNVYYFNRKGQLKRVLSHNKTEEIKNEQLKQRIRIDRSNKLFNELVYNGSNNIQIKQFVNDYLKGCQKIPMKSLYNMYFKYGYYQYHGDTIGCYISEFYDPNSERRFATENQYAVNELGYLNEYLFLITYNDDKFKVLTAKEVDGYSDHNRTFVSASVEDECFFIEKLSEKGDLTLYQRGKIITDKYFYYLIANHREKKVIILAPNDVNHSLSKIISHINISGLGQYSAIIMEKEYEIRKYLCSLPNMNEKLIKRINNGIYPPSHLDVVFQKYISE